MIIPPNMRDGCIIGIGKGNSDWYYSAPHGAGRLLSRSAAKKELSVDTFFSTMKGIFTTCISQATLDESPMAYKNWTEIAESIVDTVQIQKIIKPIFNFKASE